MSDEFTLSVPQAKELHDAIRRNGGTNADVKALCIGDTFARILPVLRSRGQVVIKSIFTPVREILLKANAHKVTSKKYWEDACVVNANEAFVAQFSDELVLQDTNQDIYVVHKLEQTSSDTDIIAELGGVVRAEVPVSHFNAFLVSSKKSKEWTIFYLRGKNGNLWVVIAFWSPGLSGWNVQAFSVTDEGDWNTHHRIVSRKYLV